MNLLNYISRIGKSRGFGIQSPWAYSFVRDVIFERMSYYEYEDIKVRYSDSKEQKRQKLFFRLRNYAQQNHLSYKTVGLKSFHNDILTPDTLLVITDTNKDYARWQTLEQSPEIGVTFDLYELVIVFPPTHERGKQTYKLNF